jgi:hypothetical protein
MMMTTMTMIMTTMTTITLMNKWQNGALHRQSSLLLVHGV